MHYDEDTDIESAEEDDDNTDLGEDESEGKKISSDKKLIGTVELFFNKINVAAIRLTGPLKVGDIIEIEDAGRVVKFVVSSMQINKKDVTEASAGDSIGIKVSTQVKAGSNVYLVHI